MFHIALDKTRAPEVRAKPPEPIPRRVHSYKFPRHLRKVLMKKQSAVKLFLYQREICTTKMQNPLAPAGFNYELYAVYKRP